jgi:hypothetical protein
MLPLSLAGLAILLGLVGWFAWSVWSLRDVWARIYVVNDPGRTEVERINAAYELSRDGRVSPRQRWDLCLSRVPPDLARYLLAESLRGDAIEGDVSGYALSVARSEGWPDWLRLLLVRPLAYGAGQHALPAAPLAELREHPDEAISLWAAYAQAAGRKDESARLELAAAASSREPITELAGLLWSALEHAGGPAGRAELLDQATLWARANHPDSHALWRGWAEEGGRIVALDERP